MTIAYTYIGVCSNRFRGLEQPVLAGVGLIKTMKASLASQFCGYVTISKREHFCVLCLIQAIDEYLIEPV